VRASVLVRVKGEKLGLDSTRAGER